jgi:hypothetical protein
MNSQFADWRSGQYHGFPCRTLGVTIFTGASFSYLSVGTIISLRAITIIIIMAPQPFAGPWPFFQFRDPIHSRQDGGSARRKACTYTQNNTNTE